MNFGVFAFQAVPDAPARPSAEQQAPPPRGEGGPPPSAGFSLLTPLMILIPFAVIMFWQSRSQQKKQEASIAALKKGDRVLTQSGLVGRLIAIEGRYARLELPPSGTKVTILRSGLLGRDTETEPSGQEATSEKPKAQKSGD